MPLTNWKALIEAYLFYLFEGPLYTTLSLLPHWEAIIEIYHLDLYEGMLP